MPRVKGGTTTRRRHKKVLKLTRGHRASSHSLYKRARESMLHSLSYAYRHRRERKRDMRRLWIARINAAAREHDLPYNKF
ncbi:50S ribosomal protein L20, partial [Dehalococcoidia bacterium]|nr:50S ribosomal protein L20 [Dehalococcoidia bacterium]